MPNFDNSEEFYRFALEFNRFERFMNAWRYYRKLTASGKTEAIEESGLLPLLERTYSKLIEQLETLKESNNAIKRPSQSPFICH